VHTSTRLVDKVLAICELTSPLSNFCLNILVNRLGCYRPVSCMSVFLDPMNCISMLTVSDGQWSLLHLFILMVVTLM